MGFQPERLIELRESLGISKAEAARRLNMSAMGYGRYENGSREPSFQTVSFIASTFDTTTDYLYGKNTNPESDILVISKDNTELYELIRTIQNNKALEKKVLAYYKKMLNKNPNESEST